MFCLLFLDTAVFLYTVSMKTNQNLGQNVTDKGMKDKKSILFICTHNSARSHMAEGLMNALYGDRYAAFSAGVEPSAVNPFAIKAMSEIGIDISGHRSKSVDEFLEEKFDYIITVCDHAMRHALFSLEERERVTQRI